MPGYIQKIDQPSGIRPTSHSPEDRGSEWRAAWFRATVGRLGRALEGVQPGRSSLALSTRAVIVVLAALLFSACSGGGSPTAPTPPVATTPPAAPAPAPVARLVIGDALEMISCVNGRCSFRGLVRNTGDACASNIRGESWIISAQGVEVGRASWVMLSTTVMRPGDEVYYMGDGMPQVVLNHLDGRYFASFLFDSRNC